MDSNPNDLQQKVDASRKGLVDNTETRKQGVSAAAGRPIRGQDWTSILRRANLEAPGYLETVEKMKKDRT